MNNKQTQEKRKQLIKYIEKHGEKRHSETLGDWYTLMVTNTIFTFHFKYFPRLDTIEVFNYREDNCVLEDDELIEDLFDYLFRR